MEVNPKQHIRRLIHEAQNILIFTHTHVDGDALGSSLGLCMVLKKMGKNVHCIIEDPAPDSFAFLPGLDCITKEIGGGKDFIISVNCTNTEIEHVSYEQKESRMDIVITPKTGLILADDISFGEGKPKFDLIFVLDSSNLELIGKTFRENADLFYETPIINVDHHASNEYFGKINLVDITATSTAEIILSFIESLDEKSSLMDENIATCLLTGVITDTGSFQNANTTPKAFSIAAQLLAAGARQQEIIKNVYKTHQLSTLKLWGKALTKLTYDQDAKLVWSYLSSEDFKESNAESHETSGVIDELLSSAPDADVVLLLKEGADNILRGSLRSIKMSIDVAKIAEKFNGGGHKRAAGFKMPGTTLEEGINVVIPKLKDIIKRYPESLQDSIDTQQQSDLSPTPAPAPAPVSAPAPVEPTPKVETPDPEPTTPVAPVQETPVIPPQPAPTTPVNDLPSPSTINLELERTKPEDNKA